MKIATGVVAVVSSATLILLTLSVFLVVAVADGPATMSAESTQHDARHLQSKMTADDARHLLMRTGIGSRPADVMRLTKMTRQQGIESIVQGLTSEVDVPMPGWVNQPLPRYHARTDMADESRARFNRSRDAELVQLRQWWVLNMLQSSSPQSERLVLFWHDLFATNYFELNKQSLAMARQNQTFRELGFGSWERLLKAMIRDSALLAFLNSGSNHKASPNENLARELMELFVLGEGNYDEATVREAARALTGHDTAKFHDLQFQLRTGAQDRDNKQLFGETGAFDGDDLIELLLTQDAAPRFLATRFWHGFVSDVSPEAAWVNEQAEWFKQSEFDIATLYTNVLSSEAFWHSDNRGAMIKSPIDLVAGTARTLNYPIKQWQSMPQWQALIGMNLFAPPNVSGWKEGAAFVTPGHLLNRYRVVRQLTSNRVKGLNNKGNDMQMAAEMQLTMQAGDTTSSSQAIGADMGLDTKLTANGKHGAERLITASAVHLQRSSFNVNQNKRIMEIILDDVATPSRELHHVRFSLTQKDDNPIMLQLDSFSCWPDCVEVWPECSRTNKHFIASKYIAFPWAENGSEHWSQQHSSTCQFSSLTDDDKQLVSTLWAQMPTILAQLQSTNRFSLQEERWGPVVDFMINAYHHAPAALADTPYANHVLALNIDQGYAPVAPAPTPLDAPGTAVNDIQELSAALQQVDLQLHKLLIPVISGSNVPLLSTDQPKRPERYLRQLLEHPLFQLK